MKIKIIVIMLIVPVAIFFGFIHSGIFNVAATEQHSSVVAWILHTTMKKSVKTRAGKLKIPTNIIFSKSKGLKDFGEMCVLCHGAPGIKRSSIGIGLNPRPPALREKAKEWTMPELFWIVKNGIKMSGMPAFGPTHTDEQIWQIVFFIKNLPDIKPQEYQGLIRHFDH